MLDERFCFEAVRNLVHLTASKRKAHTTCQGYLPTGEMHEATAYSRIEQSLYFGYGFGDLGFGTHEEYEPSDITCGPCFGPPPPQRLDISIEDSVLSEMVVKFYEDDEEQPVYTLTVRQCNGELSYDNCSPEQFVRLCKDVLTHAELDWPWNN